MKKLLYILLLILPVMATAQGVVILGGGSSQQSMSLTGNILSISGGGSVDLSGYLDNTDGQTVTDLSLSGDILSITLSGGNTKTVDLSTISGGTSMTPAQVKDSLLANADTNILTDAEKTTLGNITASNPVDLDGWQPIIATVSGKIDSDTFGRTNATAIANIYEQGNDDYISDGAPASGTLTIVPDAPPIKIETTATFDLSEKKVYNDITADAGTITVSGLESAVELYIYIDRSSAPTLAGATWDPIDGTAAFEANVPMILYGVVHPNKTTINYCYIKL